MAPTREAPKLSKNRKLGKGKKKAWRAANIKDIEDFIDDERRQLISGGVVSEKSDDTLFFVDKVKTPKAKPLGKRISKENRRKRLLKSTALLRPDSNIKSVITPLKRNYKKGTRVKKVLDRLAEKVASKVRVQAVEQRKEYVERKKIAKKKKALVPSATQDIWNDEEQERPQVKRPKRLLMKPSKITATAIPHPGASVNPSYEDHQELLYKAFDAEERKQQKERHSAKAFKHLERRNVATQESYLAEMSAGLIPDSESENDVEKPDEDEVVPSVAMPRRKTKRQRQAETKLKVQLRNKKAKAEQTQRELMVERVRRLKSEIRKQDEKTNTKIEQKLKLKEEAPYKTKRLGKRKFVEQPAQFKLSTELVASMRQVKPEGHVLEDVYKSLQRRNILAPAAEAKKKRKYKKKKYIKKSHSEIK